MSSKSILKFGFVMALKIILIAIALFIAVRLPGKSVVNYYGYSVEVNTGVLIGGVIVCFLFFHQFLNFWKWLRHLPSLWKKQLAQRRAVKSTELVLEAFNTMAAGDSREAIELLDKARKLNSDDTFNSIFSAQAAYNLKNDVESEKKFSALLKKEETKFLGYRGLALLKTRQGKLDEAHRFLQQALTVRPDSPWVLGQLFNWDVQHFLFSSAETILEQLRISGYLTKTETKRKKAVLHWVKAEHNLKESDFEGFYESVHQTLKLAPELTEATLALTNYYGESNRQAKAWKYLKKGYASNPHPSFLPALKQLFRESSALELYQLGEELTASQPKNPTTHLILGRLALEAKLWGQARAHLAILRQVQPTQSYFELLAELESKEHPGKSEISQSLYSQATHATRDHVWICQNCHVILPKWHAFCSSCQAFDQVTWGNEEKIKQLDITDKTIATLTWMKN